MKRLLIAALAALGLSFAARSARADCAFEYSCCRHFSYVRTSKQRCITITSHCNPLPCAPSCCGPSCGPAMWDGLAAYGYGAYGYGNPYGVAAAAPAAAAPSFNAPQPTPAPKAPSANGLQQAGYFHYAPTAAAGYNYGYGYGAAYGYGYFQAPSYWYDN